MKTAIMYRFTLGIILMAPVRVAWAAGPEIPERVKGSVRHRVEERGATAIVIGLVDSTGETFFSYGHCSVESEALVDEDSIFEIGSITKTFTSILLADLVGQGKADLDDPIEKYLPDEVKVPSRGGRKITLRSLAAHDSGLPRLPTNLAPADISNPYADYGVDRLYEFLSSHELSRDVGARFEYSNLGAGLLGHIVSRIAGQSYEAMVVDRICNPVGMESTVITLTLTLQARLAKGHAHESVVPNWDLTALAGAGAIRSSARDMLRFVAANLGIRKSSVLSAMRLTHKRQRDTQSSRNFIGLGWHTSTGTGTDITWHNGGTGGYRSFCGFSSKKRMGVVVLSNSSDDGVDDLGFHLLDQRNPLLHRDFTFGRTKITLKEAVLKRYAGRYSVRPGLVFTLTAEGGKLVFSRRKGHHTELLAESETKFFSGDEDLQARFLLDDDGRVTGMVVQAKGREKKANRIE